jgi:hypothetical protein
MALSKPPCPTCLMHCVPAVMMTWLSLVVLVGEQASIDGV